MQSDIPTNDPQERLLWEIARKRASFKSHLVVYVLVNASLWLLWLFNDRHYTGHGMPWPVWPTFGWGLGLVSHYIRAYVFPKEDAVQREYEKLKSKK